jgi:adenylate kinase family enzyme
MNEQSSKHYLVFGLTGAGKTTFAAALWHLLDSREIPTVLAKGKHSGNFHYLEKITQRWCDGWKLERTKTEEVEDVSMNLLHQESGTKFSLEFRDLAGESLQTAFETRYCDPEFVDLVKQADGMLLFVSADREMDDVTILDVKAQMGDDEEETAKRTRT